MKKPFGKTIITQNQNSRTITIKCADCKKVLGTSTPENYPMVKGSLVCCGKIRI